MQSFEDVWSKAHVIRRILSNILFPLLTFPIPKHFLNLHRVSKMSTAPSLSKSWESKQKNPTTCLQILAYLAYNMQQLLKNFWCLMRFWWYSNIFSSCLSIPQVTKWKLFNWENTSIKWCHIDVSTHHVCIFSKICDKIEQNSGTVTLWYSYTQKIYSEKFNMNSNTKFDQKLHTAQIILSLSILNYLKSAGIPIIDKFSRFSLLVSLFLTWCSYLILQIEL